jgi:hypothetical protein
LNKFWRWDVGCACMKETVSVTGNIHNRDIAQ